MNIIKRAGDMEVKNNEHQHYLIFVDHRFSEMAEKALRSVLLECDLEPYKVNNNHDLNTVFFKLDIKNAPDDVAKTIKESASSFVDFVMPVDATVNTENSIDYKKVEETISKVIDDYKYLSFMIEVKKIDRVLDITAKSIEVRLGEDLEKLGYKVDLKTPEVMIYVILLKTSVIIGHIDNTLQKGFPLDPFRRSNKEGIETLNRAEFKIEEAIRFFEVDLSKHKMGLDIGAAPGGWTHYLSQHGIKMVAVDNALLNYKILGTDKRILILTDGKDMPQVQKILENEGLSDNVSVEEISNQTVDFNKYDIIHIKANMKQDDRLELLKKFGKFDFLTIDTNTLPSESTTIANSLIELLDPGASLIMTTKLMTRNFGKYIYTVETELSKNYRSVQLKKLPHNRREFTVYGVYSGSQR